MNVKIYVVQKLFMGNVFVIQKLFVSLSHQNKKQSINN